MSRKQNNPGHSLVFPVREGTPIIMYLHGNISRKWGFVSYLRELIDGPDAVMAYLCKQYRIYDIPVGSERTRQCVQEVSR